MTRSTLFRAAASVAVASFFAAAAATTAAADDPAPASLTLGTLGTLTLPAGDSVRDTTSLSITASAPTTVSLVVRPAGGGDAIATLSDVEIADAATPATVEVDVEGLTAGALEVVATPTGGEPTIAPLTVGSGEPISVDLSLSAASIFTWSGATPRTSVATVSATDETGLAVPFHGKVTAVVGGKTYAPAVASTDGAAATASLPVSKFGLGTGTVVAAVSGSTADVYSSDTLSLKVAQTAITSVALATSVSTVYPYKDSYKDSVTLTVTPKKTNPATFKVTGYVKITRNGKTVKSWTLNYAKTYAITWDGRVGGKIVPGTYTIKASMKGPEGSTHTYSKTVVVSSKKLVTKTKSVTYAAKSVFKKYIPLDPDENAGCYYDWPRAGHIYCDGYMDSDGEAYSVLSLGTITVPSEVQTAQKYGSAKVSATLYSVTRNGESDWYFESDKGTKRSGELASGTKSLGSITLPATTSKVYITLGVLPWSELTVGSVKVTYSYKALVS